MNFNISRWKYLQKTANETGIPLFFFSFASWIKGNVSKLCKIINRYFKKAWLPKYRKPCSSQWIQMQCKASISWKRETQAETLAPLLNAFYLSGASEWTYFHKCVYHTVTTLIPIFKEIKSSCCQNGAQIIHLIVFLGYSFVSQFKDSFSASSQSIPIPIPHLVS